MSPSPLEYIRHMLEEAEYLTSKARVVTKEEFARDETLKRAFVRSIEVIGEAVKKVPAQFRTRHASIEWRVMAAMRDRLIHGYFGVDYDIVWDVATTKMPVLTTATPRDLAPGIHGIIELLSAQETASTTRSVARNCSS